MENTQRVPIPERLREAMQDAGKKQADLVRETGIDKGALSSYLSGKYEPKQKAIGALARALNVSEMWLWGYDVPQERPLEQKKNDDLVKVIARLRKDPAFYELVTQLDKLPADEFASIKQLTSALVKK